VTLLALALLLQAAAPAAEEAPVALVRQFLAAVDRNDGSAEAMVAADAQMGAGDVGGLASLEAIRQMNVEFARHCRLTRLASNPRQFNMPGREIVDVTGPYHCVSDERPEGHDLDVSYLVEGHRIAGLYINVESGLGRGGNE
jgi:hypothetical protein